ncbi:MAG: membrane protein insertase YidC [Vicinamibacteria bacterium]|nr:membrane protein insertase YidC [Vicinamibacteria bacterium]
MEERRLLLAVALSFLVLTGYRLLFPPPARPQRPPTSAPAAPAASAAAPDAVVAGPSAEATPTPAVEAVVDERERRVEVTGLGRALAFSNRGARLVSWRLDRFHDERGAPLELVRAAVGGPWPLDLETGDREVDAALRAALFQSSSEMLTVGAEGSLLRFAFAAGDLEANKELNFRKDGLVEVRAVVRKAGRELPVRLSWGPGLGNPTAAEQAVQGYVAPQGVWFDGGATHRVVVHGLEAPVAAPAVRWVGVESQYFAALMVPAEPAPAEVRRVEVPSTDPAVPKLELPVALLPLGPAGALLFVGAKDYDGLARVGHQLHAVVGVGDWIGPIVVPLLRLLRFVHGYVGNYGWAIVALTVFINLVMAPLRHLSIANGMKMAKMAPEMKVIQERYRKVPPLDPKRQEMHAEMTALYAKHGMNMGSQMLLGCLPLLLTMPFLFAFYRVLQVSIDLRGAPFLWIPDLSHRDPWFATPILMGLSMVLMQKFTPSAMDPAQQRIMMLMPLVLVVMFFAAPAGLNLYWLASNVCAIVQQAITLKLLHPAEPAPERKKR